jgi:CubicO group peptidase (beta-lactamase class C family)
MNRIAVALVAVALAAAGVLMFLNRPQRIEPIVVVVPPGPTQPKVSPAEAGIDPLAIDEAVQYAGPRNTRALVIGHGGHIVFEKYWDDTTLETPVDLPGFAPVLAALVTGTMMSDRLINSLDAPSSNYIPEDANTPRGATTLRELMAQDNAALDVEASANRLALVLERAAKQPYQALVVDRLWKPMEAGNLAFEGGGGMQRPRAAGAGCCIRARLGDWMRVAELLANDGVFAGNQFTPPRFVEQMLRPAHKDSARGFFTRVDGAFATHDVARLEAAGKQRLWIVPSLRLTIVRVGGEPPADRGWDEATIPDSIIRGTAGWQPRSAGEGVDPNKFAPH